MSAKGDAAMYVMGNFSVGAYRDAGLTDDQIDYFQFPDPRPGLPMAEETAMHSLFHRVPRTKRMRFRDKKTADTQSKWNMAIGQLPPNAKATVGDDKFIQEGFAPGAAGLAQFYDRDAPAAMASEGMKVHA